MSFPAAKKLVLAFSQLALALGLAIPSATALADVTADYEQGMASFRNGDLFSAMAPLRRAADAGNAPAQATLAYILDLGEFNEDAVRYYTMSADQGYAPGIHGLAGMVLIGDGTPQDTAKAYELFTKAALLNHEPAWSALADGILNKRLEPPNGTPNTETILIKSAESGYLRSVDALVLVYGKGQFGIAPNPEKAAQWSKRAIELRAETARKK